MPSRGLCWIASGFSRSHLLLVKEREVLTRAVELNDGLDRQLDAWRRKRKSLSTAKFGRQPKGSNNPQQKEIEIGPSRAVRRKQKHLRE